MIFKNKTNYVSFAFCSLLTLAAVNGEEGSFDPTLHEQILPQNPQDSLEDFVVQDGYRMELVASEPMVEEPVLFEFDGNGRMYVAEMLTYMQDADSSGSLEPHSVIKRLEDTDGDGVMDHFTVFADGLLLPRMILSLDEGRILVRETNTRDILLIEDLDGDGVSDKRSVYWEGGPRGGNMEHQPSGLLWNIDNWIYVTYTEERYRFSGDGLVTESMAYGGGQWGLTQDETGRMFYSTAGGEDPAFAFQFPSVYGKITVEDEQSEGFLEVFPLDTTPDVQGGPKRLRKDGTLNKFTGVGGQGVYLGNSMPELVGDLFLPEPVGNLIRRAKTSRENGYTILSNPYQDEEIEFVATSDPNFRPVWSGTAPDGGLLFVDMYRGIIQEGHWTKPGSYLRGVIDQYGFDRNIGRGRIYRLTRDGAEIGELPRMYEEPNRKLVSHLGSANGWWRMTAQKLIVLSQDPILVKPLKRMARKDSNPLARLHALWTLEGLGVVDEKLLLDRMLKDEDSRVRAAAVRISEQIVDGSASILAAWQSLNESEDIEVSQQVLLSSIYTEQEDKTLNVLWKAARAAHGNTKGLEAIEENERWMLQELERREQMAEMGEAFSGAYERGRTTFNTLCYTCHGEDGKGVSLPDGSLLAPKLEGNPRVAGDVGRLSRILMHGLQGPIEGETFGGGLMAGMGSNGDEWLADVVTYIQSEYAGLTRVTEPDEMQRVRELESGRVMPWTMAELDQKLKNRLLDDGAWKLSSSEGGAKLEALVDGNLSTRWNSSSRMAQGQWIEIEFPERVALNRIALNSSRALKDYARGYKLEVSLDGKLWTLVEENLRGSPYALTEALGVPAKAFRVSIVAGNPERRWILNDLEVYGSYLIE